MSGKNPEALWFGDRPVTVGEKSALVKGVFSSVASSYDLMNDFMSLGVHRLWKDRFVGRLRPRNHEHLLDVAGGTGDIALRLAVKAPQAKITVCDLNPAMVEIGRDRALDQGNFRIEWNVGDAQSLPFPDSSFDAYTISFGLRNVPEIDTALDEAFRVLRRGSRFFCLEFSHVCIPGLAQAYDAYSRVAIPFLGQTVARDRASYEYLVESIRRFPAQADLRARIESAGFERAGYENLSGGIAAIHHGYKL